ncbi:MAG: YdjY domain-containing protein [Chthoniobacteraceae bacterium]
MPSRAAILLFAAVPLLAQTPPEFKPPKEIAPGVFEIGAVRLDKAASTVTFPARVNMNDGLIEYLMVSPQGAVHESVLVSDAQPQDVHMAMLLLGAKGMAAARDGKAPERIDAEFLARAPKLTGDRVFLTVKWKDNAGREQAAPAERWVERKVFTPRKPSKTVAAGDGPWLYTGSFIYEGRFIAQVEGAFVAMVTFPSALINNPRTGSTDDHVWFVKTDAVPPVGTPVEFSIKLQPAENPAK